MTGSLLRVDGEVDEPLELTFADLEAFSADEQVRDVSRFDPKRKGDGISLNALLGRVELKPTATFLTLHATADDFAASIPLDAVRDEGILVYAIEDRPLTAGEGGPYRFLIRDFAACHTAELDDCANVKFVDRIELTAGRGRDTRPITDSAHEELHRHQ